MVIPVSVVQSGGLFQYLRSLEWERTDERRKKMGIPRKMGFPDQSWTGTEESGRFPRGTGILL